MKKQRKRSKGNRKRLVLGLLIISIVLVLWEGVKLLPQQQIIVPPTNEASEKADFIATLKPIAQKNYQLSGLLPSVSLSQAILESDWGQSELAIEAKNLFGIKGKYHNQSLNYPTQEFQNDEWVTITAAFRKYDSWEQSMNDQVTLFQTGTSWNATLYHPVLAAQTYQEGTKALQAAGYATDPDYARKLNEVIERYELNQYDQL